MSCDATKPEAPVTPMGEEVTGMLVCQNPIMRRLLALPLFLTSAVAFGRTVKDAPAELSASAVLAPAGEPGERLIVDGTVVATDGKPLPGAVVYAYHTDASGIYGPEG